MPQQERPRNLPEVLRERLHRRVQHFSPSRKDSSIRTLEQYKVPYGDVFLNTNFADMKIFYEKSRRSDVVSDLTLWPSHR